MGKRILNWQCLTKTFLDAILVTQQLNIQYLWIDSLRIIQDSKIDGDFESSLMAKIYSNGFCNISAIGAMNGSRGLFFDRDYKELDALITHAQVGGKSSLVSLEKTSGTQWAEDVEHSRLTCRG